MQKLAELMKIDFIKKQFPIDEALKNDIQNHRKHINDIITGNSSKKLLIVGPCSMDFEESILEYASRLIRISKKVEDKIIIVMRTYTSKPRTTVGWKGMIYSGEFGSKGNINDGISTSRDLMIKIGKLGLPVADEMLYPQLINYFDDIISYIAVGARSSENQMHREISSGLEIAVGVKNPTSGDINVTSNSLISVRSSQDLLLDGNHYRSVGNPFSHIILRGVNYNGISSSNINDNYINNILLKLNSSDINTKFVIDLNHDNSGKNGIKQIENLESVLKLKNFDRVAGLMIESYLGDGNQKGDENDISTIQKGISLTDSCLGWEKTQDLIMKFYEKI